MDTVLSSTRRSVRRFAVGAALLLSFAGPAAADVYTVGPTGDFPDIQLAVDFATDGDVILVQAGAYGSVVISNKTLSITADTDAAVTTQDIVVQDLTLGRNVSLAGLTVTFSGASQLPGLTAVDNVGGLRVADCDITGQNGSIFQYGGPGAVIASCGNVSFVGSVVSGGGGFHPAGTLPGSLGVDASDSVVSFHGGSVVGGAAVGTNTFPALVGGIGLRAEDTEAFASGTLFRGGTGGAAMSCLPGLGADPGGVGGAGVSLVGGLSIFRQQDCLLLGGAGGPGSFPDPTWCPSGGAQGPTGPDLVDPLAANRLLGGTAHGFEAPTPLREFVPFTASLVGEPGDLAAVLTHVGTASSFQSGVNAQLLLQLTFQVKLVGVLPASGVLEATTAFPDLGLGVQEEVLFTQPLFLGTGGELNLGAPYTAIVLDSAF